MCIRDRLQAGEVGYLTASIKTVQDTRVGDTVTLANNPTPEALPGYRQVKPMVFLSLIHIFREPFHPHLIISWELLPELAVFRVREKDIFV